MPDLSCRRKGSGHRADSSTITSLYNVAMNGVVRRDASQNIFTARCFSSDREQNAEAKNETAVDKSPSDEINIPGAEKGGRKLAIIFTCTQCDTRSAKQFTEKAYKQGVVIATCPGCQNKHLIADNLGFFSDEEEGWTIEKAMARLGGNVKVATDDNVLELSVEDLFSKDAIEQAVRSASEIPEADENKSSK